MDKEKRARYLELIFKLTSNFFENLKWKECVVFNKKQNLIQFIWETEIIKSSENIEKSTFNIIKAIRCSAIFLNLDISCIIYNGRGPCLFFT